jgi:hypothetical protein
MLPFPANIFTEPDVSPNDLANLGPLRRLAGVWQADKGVDINPKAKGPERREVLQDPRSLEAKRRDQIVIASRAGRDCRVSRQERSGQRWFAS